MTFYVGLDDLYYAFRFNNAFISVNRLKQRKSFFKVNRWIMDSGAFTEISTHGRYRTTVEEYAAEINRWKDCGNLEMAVSQDYMCEPFILEKTGFSVETHQKLTISRFDALKKISNVPVMPVLQGFLPGDYLTHLNSYGDRLTQGMRVGVGSVCKRNSHPAMISFILSGIKRKRPDLKLHGFGLKLTALRRGDIRNLLFSSDSMAWSFAARKNGRSAHDWNEAENYRKKIDEENTEFELFA